MADVVNLRRARKTKDRMTKAAQADANRAAFGRTRAERDTATAEIARRARALDGARREP